MAADLAKESAPYLDDDNDDDDEQQEVDYEEDMEEGDIEMSSRDDTPLLFQFSGIEEKVHASLNYQSSDLRLLLILFVLKSYFIINIRWNHFFLVYTNLNILQTKDDLELIIKKLGGQISQENCFDLKCSHLLTG